MFAIYAKTPRYDNRDGFAGYQVEQATPYAYETVELAQKMLPNSYDEEGEPTDVIYFVADTSDKFRREIHRQSSAADYADDIEF